MTLGAAAVVGASVSDSLWLPSPAVASPAQSLVGASSTRLAMHVHGSWSEGSASWQAQCDQAARNGIDVLYMTDHDTRKLARGYLTSTAEATWGKSSTGTLARQEANGQGPGYQVLAESASRTRPATVTLQVNNARGRLRTSISGQTLVHTVKSAYLTGGAVYEIVVTLSYHPAMGGRRAGQYELVYRFGVPTKRRFTESGGLRGVVTLPTPTAGSVQRLRPDRDVAAIWPDMHAPDNSMYGYAVVARSPKKGAVANVRVSSVLFERTRHTPDRVRADQATLAALYALAYPRLSLRPASEFSHRLPDLSGFGIPQYLPDYDALPDDVDTAKREVARAVQQQGGLVSWNHPFGSGMPPLLTREAMEAKRRQVFRALWAQDLYGCDILEVGYTTRGEVDAATHLGLWDTFSRAGRFLTGNGVTDDHTGLAWRSLVNGMATGVWSRTRSDAEVTAALAGGRAYFAHMGLWRGGAIDLLVDDKAPMGSVWVGGTGPRRKLTVMADALPSGAVVQVVTGPVDYTGADDPATAVTASVPAADFAGGSVEIEVPSATSCFHRAQVLAADGTLLGSGNPVWLLDNEPAKGVPAARRVE